MADETGKTKSPAGGRRRLSKVAEHILLGVSDSRQSSDDGIPPAPLQQNTANPRSLHTQGQVLPPPGFPPNSEASIETLYPDTWSRSRSKNSSSHSVPWKCLSNEADLRVILGTLADTNIPTNISKFGSLSSHFSVLWWRKNIPFGAPPEVEASVRSSRTGISNLSSITAPRSREDLLSLTNWRRAKPADQRWTTKRKPKARAKQKRDHAASSSHHSAERAKPEKQPVMVFPATKGEQLTRQARLASQGSKAFGIQFGSMPRPFRDEKEEKEEETTGETPRRSKILKFGSFVVHIESPSPSVE